MHYYNEYDPKAAAWLRELINAGEIPAGDVDTRSIEDVKPNELTGYTQCHFFAGIGGWPLALRLAGVPESTRLWTGSCPCQPFSTAGKGTGFADERHLWPAFFWLIDQCRPSIVFGEQVASRDGLNWLDLVCADLEGAAYAVGAADLCAAGVGAPHIRQRLYWVAHATDQRYAERHRSPSAETGWAGQGAEAVRRINSFRMADASSTGRQEQRRGRKQSARHPADGISMPADPLHGFWSGADWLGCRDGKLRPVEPGSFPLAHGIPARVAALRGYGNAIVPEVAAQFIQAVI